MSYCRWPVYIWSDGTSIHLWARAGEDAEKAGVHPIESWCLDEGWAGGLSMPERLFDQLALARVAQMVEEGTTLRSAIRGLRSSRSPVTGNFGSYAVLRALGLDPQGEFRRMMRGTSRGKRLALDVACPTCRAAKGEVCTTVNATDAKRPHVARVTKRERKIEREIARMRERLERDGAT